jgi:hypothetical protein
MRNSTITTLNGKQVSVVDNIRVQPFTYGTSEPKATGDPQDLQKGFTSDQHVMVSLGKGIPCQPVLRKKLEKFNLAHLVTEAYRKGVPMKIKLSF